MYILSIMAFRFISLAFYVLFVVICLLFSFLFISESELIALNKEVKRSMKVAYAEGTFRNLRVQWESFFIILLQIQT